MATPDPTAVSPAPDVLTNFGPITITNTLVNTWAVIILIAIIGVILYRGLRLRPGKFQNVCEFIFEAILKFFDDITGDHKMTMKFLPLVGTMFIFIAVSNVLGSLPGSNVVNIDGVSLIRAATSDLNLTVVMAIVAVIYANILSVKTLGFWGFIGKFFPLVPFFKSFTKGPMAVFMGFINIFAGLLDIIGEAAKVISLSVRLFGNIFAGNVLMSVMYNMFAILLPAPFLALGLLVAVIQAAVFATLTLVYLTVASQKPEEEQEQEALATT